MTIKHSRREFVQAVAGVGWLVLAPPIAVRARASGVRVSGRVVRAGTRAPIPQASVSNGFEIVRTDPSGAFSTEVDPARYPFVFVNTPAGYRASRTHYRHVADPSAVDVEFVLEPAPERLTDRIRIAHVTDSHIGVPEKPHFASSLEVADDYRWIVKDCRPDLILHTGDFTDNGRRADMQAYTDAVADVGVPVVTVYGNHDSDADRAEARGNLDRANNAVYLAVMGPDQFSFDWGPYHVIVCGMYWIGRPFRLPRMEAWLKADLASLAPQTPVVLLTHDKPRLFPEVAGDAYGPGLGQLPPSTRLVLHGHHHMTCAYRHEGIAVVCAPTVSIGAIDTSPRGYALIELDRERADVEFRPIASHYRSPVRGARERPADVDASAIGLEQSWAASVGTTLHRAAPVIAGRHVVLSLGDRLPFERVGLMAVDLASGEDRWLRPLDAAVKNSIGVGPHDVPELAGSGFAMEFTGRLTRVDLESGAVRWQASVPFYPDRYVFATPRVTREAVYVAQHTGSYAFDPARGTLLWQSAGRHWDENRSAIYQHPPMLHDMLFYLVTSMLGYHGVSAIDRRTAEPLWTRRLDVLGPSYPPRFFQSFYPSLLVADGLLVVPGLADRLAVFEARTGDTVWDKPVLHDEGPWVGPVPSGYHVIYEHAQGLMVDGGTIYATTSNGRAYAVSLVTGERRWRFAVDRAPLVDCQPYYRGRGNGLTRPVKHGDRLYVGGADGFLYCLDATSGTLIGEADFRAPITCPPVADEDGLIVATFDGSVRRLPWRTPTRAER